MKSIELGKAEMLDYHTMTLENIKAAVGKVLENPKYLENARKIAAQFRDQKEKPLERAVWWAEWLIRNPHCGYLKSPVLRLGYIVGNSYDVIGAICFGLFLILFVVIKLCCFIVRLFMSNSPKEDRSKQHTNNDSKKFN